MGSPFSYPHQHQNPGRAPRTRGPYTHPHNTRNTHIHFHEVGRRVSGAHGNHGVEGPLSVFRSSDEPSARFDPVRWETRKTDKYGCVEIEANRYQISPAMRGRRVDVAIRATGITVKDRDGRTIAELSRVYGRSARTIQDPAAVFPALARKPRAWHDSSIRPDIPDDIRHYLDQADDQTLRSSLRAISKACQAAGFEPAMQAAQHALDLGRAIDETETPILARRFADGDIDYGDCLPDLTAYDTFNHPGRESA